MGHQPKDHLVSEATSDKKRSRSLPVIRLRARSRKCTVSSPQLLVTTIVNLHQRRQEAVVGIRTFQCFVYSYYLFVVMFSVSRKKNGVSGHTLE